MTNTEQNQEIETAWSVITSQKDIDFNQGCQKCGMTIGKFKGYYAKDGTRILLHEDCNSVKQTKEAVVLGAGQIEAVEYNLQEALKFIKKLPENQSIDKRLGIEIINDQIDRLQDYRTFQVRQV